jgi:hypothetical protein
MPEYYNSKHEYLEEIHHGFHFYFQARENFHLGLSSWPTLYPHPEARGIITSQENCCRPKLLPARLRLYWRKTLVARVRVCSFRWHLAPQKGWIEMRGETTALHSALKAGGARAILKAASF